VAFEALTGRLPFAGESPFERAAMRLVKEAPSPSSVAPGLSAAWDDLVGRCLIRDPARRPVDLGEVARAIDAVNETSTRVRKRARTLVASSFFAALLVLVGGAFALRARSHVELRAPATSSAFAVSPTPRAAGAPPVRAPLERAPTPEPEIGRAVRRAPRLASLDRTDGRPTRQKGAETPAPAAAAAPAIEVDPFAPAKPHPPHPDDLINPYGP
jgi:hypothetical protein